VGDVALLYYTFSGHGSQGEVSPSLQSQGSRVETRVAPANSRPRGPEWCLAIRSRTANAVMLACTSSETLLHPMESWTTRLNGIGCQEVAAETQIPVPGLLVQYN
jgi:hypothetical protein